MSTIIEATYDGSVFRPVGPIALEPNTPVRLIVETVEGIEKQSLSFLQTAQSLNLNGPPDWSANHDRYLYGEEAGGGS